MTGDIAELQGGLTGFRRWLQSRGFSYANAALPLPAFQSSADFSETPRMVASADEQNFVVLFFPLRRLDAEREERLCKHFRALYPRCLCFFAAPEYLQWDILCPPLEEKPPFRVRLDLSELTDRQASFLDCLTVADENALSAYRRILSAFADREASAPETATPDKREGGSQDSYSWWLSIVGKYPILTPEEERYLVRRVARGDAAAREKLILSNLRLVVNIARKFPWANMPISDLIQAGNMGLTHAASKYDYHRGFRFTTYATHWIRQAIGRAIENDARLIRFPSHLLEKIHNVRDAKYYLEGILGREPTADELAARLNAPLAKVRDWLELEARGILSLDAPAGDGTTALGELLPGNDFVQPGRLMESVAIAEEIENALSKLSDREREVLQMRFGLTEKRDEPMTLEQIGQILNLSRERARQIQEGALKKLRDGKDGDCLRIMVTGELERFVFERAVPPPRPKIYSAHQVSHVRPNSDMSARSVKIDFGFMKATERRHPLPRPSSQTFLKDRCSVPSIVQALRKWVGREPLLSDVAELTEDQLFCLPCIGRGKVHLIIKILASAGLSLRQEIPRPTEGQPAPPVALEPVTEAKVAPPTVYFVELKPEKRDAAPLSLFAMEETPQTICQNCGGAVALKPTMGGRWYRCKKCKDTRVIAV